MLHVCDDTASDDIRYSGNMKVDKDAASRFIAAAIANQAPKPAASSSFYTADATVTDDRSGPGRHSRLSTFSRQEEYRQDSKADDQRESSSEEEDLAVFEGEDADQAPKAASSSSSDDQIAARLTGVQATTDAMFQDEPSNGKHKKMKRQREESTSQKVTSTDPLQGELLRIVANVPG